MVFNKDLQRNKPLPTYVHPRPLIDNLWIYLRTAIFAICSEIDQFVFSSSFFREEDIGPLFRPARKMSSSSMAMGGGKKDPFRSERLVYRAVDLEDGEQERMFVERLIDFEAERNTGGFIKVGFCLLFYL